MPPHYMWPVLTTVIAAGRERAQFDGGRDWTFDRLRSQAAAQVGKALGRCHGWGIPARLLRQQPAIPCRCKRIQTRAPEGTAGTPRFGAGGIVSPGEFLE